MNQEQTISLPALRLISGRVNQLTFPSLTRPSGPADQSPTLELVQWGIKTYAFTWLLHFGKLTAGMMLLNDAGNLPTVRILGRSSYELCAHVYYVKKHMKQHMDANDFRAAWDFLLPITTGSRYINERFPEGEQLFPAGAHVSKAIKVFQQEAMPKSSDGDDDYSYLSEFCHPNMMTLNQYCRWLNPKVIEFVDTENFGAFGAITASAIQGLMTMRELLGLADERDIGSSLRTLLLDLVKQNQQEARGSISQEGKGEQK